jgi:hypothetical protein
MASGPFTLGDGRTPEYSLARTDYAGRPISLPDRRPERYAVLFTGPSGMGKSVELARTETFARHNGWPVFRVDASPREPLEDRFARSVGEDLGELRKQFGFRGVRRLKKTLRGLSARMTARNTSGEIRVGGILPLSGAVRHQRDQIGGDPAGSLTQLADALGELAAKKNTTAVLMVDNIDIGSDRDLNALNDLAAHLARTRQPVFLVTAGGPLAASRLLGASRELASGVETSVDQLYDIRECREFTDEDLRPALTVPLARAGVLAEPAAVEKLVQSANGNPRRLQQLGAAVMAQGQTATGFRPPVLTTDVAAEAVRRVNAQAAVLFEAAWNNSTPAEKDLLARASVRGERGILMPKITEAAGPDQWAAVDAARQSLKARGLMRDTDSGERLKFANPGMRDWVETHVGASAAHLGVALPGLQAQQGPQTPQVAPPDQGARPTVPVGLRQPTQPQKEIG